MPKVNPPKRSNPPRKARGSPSLARPAKRQKRIAKGRVTKITPTSASKSKRPAKRRDEDIRNQPGPSGSQSGPPAKRVRKSLPEASGSRSSGPRTRQQGFDNDRSLPGSLCIDSPRSSFEQEEDEQPMLQEIMEEIEKSESDTDSASGESLPSLSSDELTLSSSNVTLLNSEASEDPIITSMDLPELNEEVIGGLVYNHALRLYDQNKLTYNPGNIRSTIFPMFTLDQAKNIIKSATCEWENLLQEWFGEILKEKLEDMDATYEKFTKDQLKRGDGPPPDPSYIN